MTATLASVNMAEAFQAAYSGGRWHNGSGSGSEPRNTLAWRCFLAGFIAAEEIRSVLDLGCGDGKVMGLLDWSATSYTGLDVAPAALDAAERVIPGGQFIWGDILAMPWPDADLIVVKDVLQHWPAAAVRQLWDKLEATRPPRLLIVTDLPPAPNDLPDIEPGGYRPVDVRAHPWNWPVTEFFRYDAPRPGRRYTKTVTGW